MINTITPSEKKKLKEKLRKLDKSLSNFYKYNKYTMSIAYTITFPKEYERLIKLDKKRLEIRNNLKGY